ncbi:hypothetical protein VN97_g12114 [Penicillium thymicola]|uniref:Uncharacterized protein n=1 Tax=Penicillium thymicola TaxID=293382 RepID=A0AAI9T6K5_PENTH|nr:hypothetical protein VN97_g12114 [Penicillium thymicola]
MIVNRDTLLPPVEGLGQRDGPEHWRGTNKSYQNPSSLFFKFQLATHYTSRIVKTISSCPVLFFFFHHLPIMAERQAATGAGGDRPPLRPGQIGPNHARNVAMKKRRRER